MNWRSDPLWRKLAAMDVDAGGSALTFAARLARENGWSAAHAAAVIEEYRRFLYLAATAGPATPSEDVDQAWHLHLAYSRHYWDVLCGEILGRPLHHDPTKGGRSEGDHYRRQYEATLGRYRTVFGIAPPPHIWPDAGLRFAARPLRIDAADYWLVPKRTGGRAAAVAGAALLVAACTTLAASSAGNGSPMTAILILLFLAVGAGALILSARARRKRDDGDPHDIDPGGDLGGGDGGSGCGGGGCGGN